MDNCEDAIRELEAFLDGSLSEDGHTAIHAHLAGCSDCLQAFDFQILQAPPDAEISNTFFVEQPESQRHVGFRKAAQIKIQVHIEIDLAPFIGSTGNILFPRHLALH